MCLVFIALCSWLAFQLINQSITLDYQIQHTETIQQQRDILLKVLNSVGLQVSEIKIRKILDTASTQPVFEKGEGHIVADQVSFLFKDGKLIRVED